MATEASLAIALVSALKAGFTARNITAIVQRDNQPSQQGVPTAATIFYHHVSRINVGWPAKQNVWDKVNSVMKQTMTQRIESRYQIAALAPQGSIDPTAWTPADYCNAAASVMQDSNTINSLASQLIGIRHITDIRSIYFLDDSGRNEEYPSLDIVFSHQDVNVLNLNVVSSFTETVNQI